MFSVNPQRLDARTEIAQGSFGKLYTYSGGKNDTKDWVVKNIHAKDTKELKFFIQEVVLSFNHKHPCVVSSRGYDIQELPPPPKDDKKDSQSADQDSKFGGWNIYIKMPRMDKSIRNLIGEHAKAKPQTRPELKVLIKYFYNAASGLDYLESKRIIHNNVNPGTIMIDNENIARVGAIGLAQHRPWKEGGAGLGTVLYTAPERLKKRFVLEKDTAFKGDVYSLALTILELGLLKLKRYEPEDEDDDWLLGEGKPKEEKKMSEEEKSKIGTALVEENLVNLQKEYGRRIGDIEEPESIKKLIPILRDALNSDPKNRISFSQICLRLEKEFPELNMKEEISSILNDRSRYEDAYDESGNLFYYNDSVNDFSTLEDDRESAHIIRCNESSNPFTSNITQGLNPNSESSILRE